MLYLPKGEFIGLQAVHTMKITEHPIAVFVIFVGKVFHRSMNTKSACSGTDSYLVSVFPLVP